MQKPWPPPTLDAWLDEVENGVDPEWLIPKLLPRDAIVLISGQAKRARKSLFTMLLTRALVEGRLDLLGPSWRNPPASEDAAATADSAAALGLSSAADERSDSASSKPMKALIVAYEGPAKPTAKLWRWLAGPKTTVSESWMKNVNWAHRYSHIKINDKAWVAKLCKTITEGGYTLVIIDTFRRALQGDEKDSEAVSLAVDALEQIRTATQGGCVVFVHHLRKPPSKGPQKPGVIVEDDDFDDEIRGSSAIAGAYDHHLAVRQSHAPKSLWLFTRSKIDEDRFFRLDWVIEKGAASCAVTEWTAPLNSEQLAELHDAAPTTGKPRDFAKRWNLPTVVAEEALKQLEEMGLVRGERGGFTKEE